MVDLGRSNKRPCLLYCLLCHVCDASGFPTARGKWKANDRKYEYIRQFGSRRLFEICLARRAFSPSFSPRVMRSAIWKDLSFAASPIHRAINLVCLHIASDNPDHGHYSSRSQRFDGLIKKRTGWMDYKTNKENKENCVITYFTLFHNVLKISALIYIYIYLDQIP